MSYKVVTLQINLFDGKDDESVWRDSSEQVIRVSPPSLAKRKRVIRETVQKVISQCPPY